MLLGKPSHPSRHPSVAGWLIALVAFLTLVLGAGAQAPAPEPTPLTSIAALHEVTTWDLRRDHRISLEGTVTFVASDRGLLVVQHDDSAVAIHSQADLTGLRVGDHVQLQASALYPALPSVPGFPYTPATVEVLDSFQKTEAGRPNYLDRFQAYVVPPHSGSYRFWISCDDSGELWLSEDEAPAHARRIAFAPAWTDKDEWTRYPSQRSAAIHLEAGKRYYLEALHEQADGSDHLTVAWERNGSPREVIGAEHLRAYSPELPDSDGPATPRVAPAHGVRRQVWRSATIGSLGDLQSVSRLSGSCEASDLRVIKLGRAPLPPPVRVQVGQTTAAANNFRWCETIAEIRTVEREKSGLSLELLDGENRMTAHVQEWSGAVPSRLPGYLIRLSGVCENGFAADGRLTPGTFWIQQLPDIPIVGTSPRWNQVPPSHVSELAHLAAGLGEDIPVRVRGRVVAQTSAREFTLEDEGSFSAYYSINGREWKMLGDELHVPMRDPVLVGLAVTSHGAQKTAASFDHLSGLGAGAHGDQIGLGQWSGEFAIQDGTFVVSGAGNDIWDWQDEFFFVHEPHVGDGEFIAHLSSVNVHNVWAKAGLMIRDSLAPDAPFVDLVIVGGTRLSLQWRLNRPHRATNAVYANETEFPSWLKLVRRRQTLPFSTLQEATATPGQLVEVFGYLHRANQGVAIVDGFIRAAEPMSAPGPMENDRPLIEVRSVKTWSRSSLPNYFRLRGVVTCNRTSNRSHYFAIQDATGGVFISLENLADRRTIQPGTMVDVYCDPIVMGKSTQPVSAKIIPVGRATMPKPILHPMELLGESNGDGQWVEVDGIVYAAERGGATLRAAGSDIAVEAGGMTTEDWSRLIDRRIRVQGVALDQRTPELRLLVPNASYVEELGYDLTTASAPARSIADLIASRTIPDPSHRVRVVGSITFVHGQLAVVDDGTGTASLELRPDGGSVKPGDKVEAAGFPTMSANGSLALLHSGVTHIGQGVVPAPVRTSAAPVLDGTLAQQLVTFEADVLSVVTGTNGNLLELQSDGRKFHAWCPPGSRKLASLPEGSRVQLTGFAYQGSSYLPTDPIFNGNRRRGIQFIVRSPEDIVYLHGPPWMRLRRVLYVLGALALILLVVVGWAQVLRRRVKQRTEQLNATLAKLRRETELAATLTERHRLAGEIHDSLEQGITGIMLQIEGALQSPSCPAELREILNVARNMVSFSHAEIRHAIWDLHSPVLEGNNLHTALRQMAQFVGARSPAVDVALRGTPVALSPEIEHHLLRIAQEAVTNAAKHAHASKIDLELDYHADRVELRVRDDGRGFSSENHLVDSTHFGLRSLRQRAKKMNATLNLKSSPVSGTLVEVVVPHTREVVT
jgi:signal transduction histidine kinase